MTARSWHLHPNAIVGCGTAMSLSRYLPSKRGTVPHPRGREWNCLLNRATMKCILANSFGKPDEVLSEGERPIPTVEPGSGKLLLRVHACSLTPGDYRLILGTHPQPPIPSLTTSEHFAASPS